MATNPFEEDPIIGTNDGVGITMNIGGDENSPTDGSSTPNVLSSSATKFASQNLTLAAEKITLDLIAKRLLEENYVLTALEFYTELTESGKDVKRLRDYFSNPTNFEMQNYTNKFELSPTGNLARTSSAQTLDSLDFGRYSDDGDKQNEEKVAVLEFELRKAKDTIKSLREQLTVASESSNVPKHVTSSDARSPTFETVTTTKMPIKEHERRALNFLVNEYLLQNSYKLTGVCFSEEVGDQDFEDWDEVGLNVARPVDILSLYREFCYSLPSTSEKRDFCCSVNLENESNPFFDDFESSANLMNKLNSENNELMKQNEILTAEIEKLNFEVDKLHKMVTSIRSTNDHVKSSSEQSQIDQMNKINHNNKVVVENNWQSNRKIPTDFRATLTKLTSKHCSVENERLMNDVTQIASTSDEVVSLLAKNLPIIIPNVLLNKRNEFIPLLLSVIALHPDSKERDKLLNNFFRLIKKPDDEQRQLLLAGCVSFVRHVGAIRAEAELLPQCWEQMSDKNVERRILVAEACGYLAPYLPPALLSSLLLSMLQQMLLDDKSEQVREAVVKSLAILCLYIEDRDKFSQVSDLVQKSLTDSVEQVSCAAKTLLVPTFGLWANEIGKLQLGVVNLFAKRISQIVNVSGVSQAANEIFLCTYFGCLKNLSSVLFWSAIKSGPFDDVGVNDATSVASSAELEIARYPPSETVLDDMSILFGNKNEMLSLTIAFDRHTSQEWYHSWDCLDFIVKDLLPNLVSALDRLEPSLNRLSHVCVRYFYHFVRTFGRGFCVSKIRPLFVASLNVPRTVLDAKNDLTPYGICHCTLPVYIAGVLAAHTTDADKKEMKNVLKSSFVNVAECNSSTTSILVTFAELSQVYADDEIFLSVIWDLITHRSTSVRRLCAAVLSKLIRFLNENAIRNKLLPGLITLASDHDASVRAATMTGFGGVLQVAAGQDDITEKVRMQLASFLEDTHSDGKIEVTVQLIRTFAQAAPELEARFRDEFLLPQLAVVAARNNICNHQEWKQSVAAALFETYSALSCCYLTPTAISDSFLPGLKSLLKDLDADRAKVANSIARDLESKVLMPQIERKESIASSTDVDDMKLRMFNKFRDFKDKMEQHKENVPKIFGKK